MSAPHAGAGAAGTTSVGATRHRHRRAWPVAARRLRVPVAEPARRGGPPSIEARGVTVELGGRPVVRDVSLAVGAGEVVALVGPNGAGKSTLLHALTGDIDPASGTVWLEGEPIGAWTPREQSMRRAVLPQQVAVSFPFTATEVVRMGRAPWQATDREDLDDQAVAEALAATDASHLADRTFPTLSGGERARVALARVLAQQTRLILLDEPTAALDVHHQELVMGVAHRRTERGDSVVAVLHDLGLAAAYADRIAVLSAGRLVASGPPGEVLDPDLLSEVYQHRIEVMAHPVTGQLLVLPQRVKHASTSN